MRGRTTFVIAHCLSAIRRADQILVMDSGRIVERGSHDFLYPARGRYFQRYMRQEQDLAGPLPRTASCGFVTTAS